MRRVVIRGDEGAERAETRRRLRRTRCRSARRAWNVLIEAGDAQRRARCQTVPASGGTSPAIDFQQAGLAGAVAADERDALAGLDAQVRVLEERQVPEGEVSLLEVKHAALT